MWTTVVFDELSISPIVVLSTDGNDDQACKLLLGPISPFRASLKSTIGHWRYSKEICGLSFDFVTLPSSFDELGNVLRVGGVQ